MQHKVRFQFSEDDGEADNGEILSRALKIAHVLGLDEFSWTFEKNVPGEGDPTFVLSWSDHTLTIEIEYTE